MEPWRQLAEHPTPAADTLLLDYISISKAEALLKSLKSRHWPVAIAVSGSLLIKLLTLFSTGLLTLQFVNLESKNVSLLATDRFDASAWNNKTYGYFDSVGYIMRTLAVLNYNMSFPVGTSKEFAISSLKLEDSSLRTFFA